MKTYRLSRVIILFSLALTFSFPSLCLAGDLNPSAAPAPTMRTLNQVTPTWDQILPADDSTTPDGCNSSRFKCVFGGIAVLDKETGLVWQRYTYNAMAVPFIDAVRVCLAQHFGDRGGWRLPAQEELMSLSTGSQTLPTGHPFLNVQSGCYWSSTSSAGNPTTYAEGWNPTGGTCGTQKTISQYWLCVRGGHGYDGQ